MKLNLNLGEVLIQAMKNTGKNFYNTRNIHKRYVYPGIVQQCLTTLDIFRDLFDGMPHQKNRVIRDVSKALQLNKYSNDEIIYQEGSQSLSIFLVLNGTVSACISQTVMENSQNKIVYNEIDSFEKGTGFGEGQFVAETSRTLTTISKNDETIIGKLQVQAFTQVVQNYKKRIYYRKRDMFSQCSLFMNLNPIKLEFIVNNTKPMTLNISQKLIRQGQVPRNVYLINKGQITMYRNKKQSQLKNYLSKMKLKNAYQNKEKIMLGVLEEGSFIGDLEFVLHKRYHFNAICTTEKAQVYYCDHRIILSQMNSEQLLEAQEYYKDIQFYNDDKLQKYKEATIHLQQKKRQLMPPISSQQLKLKRRLMHRHVQKKPTLIGHSTPLQILKMLKIKEARVKKQPEEDKNNPKIQLLDNHSPKKKSYSPQKLSSIHSIKTPNHQRFMTQPSSIEHSQIHLKKGDSALLMKFKSNKQFLTPIKSENSKNMLLVGKMFHRREKTEEENPQLRSIISKMKQSPKGLNQI